MHSCSNIFRIGIFILLVWTILLGMSACSSNRSDASVELHVMTAASMTDAMLEIKQLYEAQQPGVTIVPNFGSSGQLKAQVNQGAPADIFLSAAVRWMDELEEEGHINQRVDLLRNELVLVTGRHAALPVRQFEDLLLDEVRTLSIGLPDTVPAGEYARQALEKLGLYEALLPKIVFGSDVRQVLTYVETGNVDAGLVYRTDAVASDAVDLVISADEGDHEPVIYPVGLMASSAHPAEAGMFFEWLQTPEAIDIFEKYGFVSMYNQIGVGRIWISGLRLLFL